MKKIFILITAILPMLFGCSPKVMHNIAVDEIPTNHPDYAIIYFYRPGGFVQTNYKVHLGDDVVYHSKNNTKASVKVEKAGTYEIWAKTDKRESLTLNLEPGKEYFVKTTLHFGVALWHPTLELIAPEVGKNEWNNIK